MNRIGKFKRIDQLLQTVQFHSQYISFICNLGYVTKKENSKVLQNQGQHLYTLMHFKTKMTSKSILKKS